MKILLMLLFFVFTLNSQSFIDTVYFFQPGDGQNSGQSEQYYPQNIFGPPSVNSSRFVPESRPEHILSIGMGGIIIVGLKDNYIIDGEGADFTIFENAFVIQFNNKIYAEPAIISVSKDGINYIEFPYNLETLDGLAGTYPTFGNKNPFNPNESGGNSYDLSDIGIDSIKYIKIEDITQRILDNPSHNNFDPTLSGFDLDAVAIINHSDNISSVKRNDLTESKVEYYDLLGNKLEYISQYSGFYLKINNYEISKHFKYN
jgi:hypothetical protein